MRLTDVKQKESKGVGFGTCELCFYRDDYTENIYIFETSKGPKEVSDVLVEVDRYYKIPNFNVVEFAGYISEVKEPMTLDWFWLSETVKGFLSQPIDDQEHYSGKIQPIEVIKEFNLDFFEGNVLKYLFRYKKKNGVEDLRKALTYLDWCDCSVSDKIDEEFTDKVRNEVFYGDQEIPYLFYEAMTLDRKSLAEAVKEEIYEWYKR